MVEKEKAKKALLIRCSSPSKSPTKSPRRKTMSVDKLDKF